MPSVNALTSTGAPHLMPAMLGHHRRWSPKLSMAFDAPGRLQSPGTPQIIVVDDEVTLVQMVCDALEDAGFVADSCPYGRNAFPCIRAKQPQVIILDVQMPEVDGIE